MIDWFWPSLTKKVRRSRSRCRPTRSPSDRPSWCRDRAARRRRSPQAPSWRRA
jgi:hypothetical protein